MAVMKSVICAALFVLCAVTLAAQSPDIPASVLSNDIPPSVLEGTLLAGPPVPQVHSSDLGFSYSLPSDWEVISEHPTQPWEQMQGARYAHNAKELLDACVFDVLTAGHRKPASIITVSAIPFDCVGSRMSEITDKDLPGIVAGASRAMQKSINLENPFHGVYSLGTHHLWIERATGAPIAHPEEKGTVETVCSLLKRGIACWTTFAGDDAALKTFEQGAVTLEGEAATALIPDDVVQHKLLPGTGDQQSGILDNTKVLYICIGLFAVLAVIAAVLFMRWRKRRSTNATDS
jgi:hypothetical protein